MSVYTVCVSLGVSHRVHVESVDSSQIGLFTCQLGVCFFNLSAFWKPEVLLKAHAKQESVFSLPRGLPESDQQARAKPSYWP